MTCEPFWICPACMRPLHEEARRLQCENGHAFDRAREGYVHLLPAHRKRSRAPGDAKAMLRSRRLFLERGYYRPLADALGQLCGAVREECAEAAFRLLDTGCGEGYYTGWIASQLTRARADATLCIGGTDIAKDAIRMASRRYPALRFAVAGNARLPVAEASQDCLLRVFAPGDAAEVRRVLKPAGWFIQVTPGARHLQALRALVYDRPLEHDEAVREVPGLQHVRREALDYPLQVRGDGDVGRLFAMTPYYWQADQAKQAAVMALPSLDTEVSFRIDVYRLSD